MKPKRLCLFGVFGQQNLGNECTLQAIINNVQKYLPGAELNCVCTVPEDTSARHNIPAFPMSERYLRGGNSGMRSGLCNILIRFLRRVLVRIPEELFHTIKAFKILRGTQVLLVPGTGFLSDVYSCSFGWPYEMFKWSLVAKLCGCKLLYVSVGAGPIDSPLSRWFIRSALSLADFRSYRDTSTKRYLKGIGFPTEKDRVYPDLAFSLPETTIPRADNSKRQKAIVGIGLMSYAGELSGGKASKDIYWEYLDKLAIFVNWLLAHQYDVRLLIGDVLFDNSVKRDFRGILQEHAPMHGQGQIIDDPVFSVEDLLSQLAAADVVVATRFHNVLLALMLNKPVISISFHDKCASLMNEMGLSEYCQDIHHLNADRLIGQFCDLERNAEQLRPLIKQKTDEFRQALEQQYTFIFTEVLSNNLDSSAAVCRLSKSLP